MRLPKRSSAGKALPLNADIGTIVVEAVVGSVVVGGHERMDVVDSCGRAGHGVTEAEVCRTSHVVFARCEEV